MRIKKKVELDFDLLKRIAEYYEFPLAIFFGSKSAFKYKTRKLALSGKVHAFDEISKVIKQVESK